MTRRLPHLLVALTLIAVLPAPTLAAQKTVVDVVADRADAMYACGENATFRIAVSRRMGHAQSQEYSTLLYKWIPEEAGVGP